ncbi:recombinase family protein [Streptococcus suis]|uniref:recombinase family protein n=1 Tax=Streptococcus suis TaxID=1307 RepID=UPI00209BEB05|nr:recombinase family protein [Streptococcus suis]MCO8221053.1 recombinase family protein [Streptococcus suis]HEM3512575.1 recombinase family protein [Streptococcus suis]
MTVRKIESKARKTKRLRVCAYVRVSSMEEEQLASFENQIAYYHNHYKKRSDVDFIGVFMDRGISGKKTARPEFQRMLELCRQGQIDCIHTKSISRFARNTETILSVSRELKLLGIDIFFEEQNIHTLSSEGEVMLTVLASYAEEELTSHSFNVRWGYQRKFQRGEFHINAKRFLGYDVVDGQLVINQEEAEIVRGIFEAYVSGKGANRIAKELNANQVPTVTNRQWHESTIRNLLSNEKYKGDWHFQKFYTPSLGHQSQLNQGQVDSYYMEDHHSAIVSKELWQQAQECRQKRKGTTNPAVYAKRYPYTGKLFCPYCKKSLRRQLPYRTPTWMCATYLKQGKSTCEGIKIKESLLDSWKLDLTKQYTIKKKENDRGKADYTYTCQESAGGDETPIQTQVEGGRLLSSVHRPRRTAIKL